ncbi:MAG: hypothetical protein NZ518_06030, partial [Dehalococcoidia bacterium]|nr:hypothetical protein [Dehalococcoidia bacterium]
ERLQPVRPDRATAGRFASARRALLTGGAATAIGARRPPRRPVAQGTLVVEPEDLRMQLPELVSTAPTAEPGLAILATLASLLAGALWRRRSGHRC